MQENLTEDGAREVFYQHLHPRRVRGGQQRRQPLTQSLSDRKPSIFAEKLVKKPWEKKPKSQVKGLDKEKSPLAPSTCLRRPAPPEANHQGPP